MGKLLKLIHLLFFSCVLCMKTEIPCRLKKMEAGYVCVCTDTYCDSLNVPQLNGSSEWMIVTSTESGQRFDFSLGEFDLPHESNRTNLTTPATTTFAEINQNIVYQEMFGFGGSITGAVTYVLNKLTSVRLRECIYKSYYTNDYGLGYTLIRIPIGGCDFDSEPWTYNQCPKNDLTLSDFTELHPKDVLRMAIIKECMNVTGNFEAKIIGVAWGPPKWMKTKDSWSGEDANQLKLEYYQTWADYHLKWLNLMNSTGINVWAISTGNEPNFSIKTPFIGLNWNASSQAKWIAKNLGPTIKQSNYHDVKIHTYDDNRDTLLWWLNEMNTSYADAMDYVSAIGIHGYFDSISSPNVLDVTKANFPDKLLLYTEMCFGVTGPISQTGPTLGSWKHAEELIEMLMDILLHNVNGYIDWNIILDAHGGPNYINNVVDAFIVANDDFTEIYKQPLFYAAAHFSKFILPHSKRIDFNIASDDDDDDDTANLSSLAFLRPDGQVVAILYNKHPHKVIKLNIIDALKGRFIIEIQPKSLNTLIYNT